MKKKFLTCLLALISLGLFAQTTRVIENPAYEVKHSGLTTITKIECTNTETRLYLHYSFLPKWWIMFDKDQYLEDCKSGKKYKIKEVVNVEFDKKEWMPMSGENDFVLIYEPLDKGVEKINYGDDIFGVSLTKEYSKKKTNKLPKKVKKWFKKELSKVKKTPLNDFNSSEFFSNEPAKLIGYIKGYDPRLGFKTGITYMGNVITREDYPIVIEIHEDGRFEAELPLTHPIHEYFYMNDALINYYLEPGQTLAMVLDWEEFLLADRFRKGRYDFERIEFYGPLATTNQELLSYKEDNFDYRDFQKQQKEVTPKKYKKTKIKKNNSSRVELLKFLVSHNISKKTTAILQNKFTLDHATTLFNFVSNRDYYAKKDTLNEVLKAPVPKNYYSFLEEIDLNDQSLLVNNRFSEFINRFEYCKPINVYPKRGYKQNFAEYSIEHQIQLPKEYADLITALYSMNNKSKRDFYKKNKEIIELYDKKFETELKAYHKEINKPNIDKWTLRDSVITNVFKLDKNLVYDITKVRSLNFSIKDKENNFAHEYWKLLEKEIAHPFLKQEGKRILETIHSSDSKNNSKLVTQLPKGTASDIFNKIIAPYKGKILFVDFWGTTCSPCVGGIKRMKETREKYKNHPDFDFVFITSERNSPKKAYDKFVKEQELENIHRLSMDEFNYLRQLFKFNGIPKYVVIDKNGDVIDNDFSMYKFKRELDAILDKHK